MIDHCLRTVSTRLAGALAVVAVGVLSMLAPTALQVRSAEAAEALPLAVREGRLIRLPRPAAAVFVADPETADVQTHSPNLIYVFGKRAGSTTLVAVGQDDSLLLEREIRVHHDLERLSDIVAEIAPGDNVTPRSIAGGIVLGGDVAQPRDAQLIREAAARFLGPEEAVVDQLRVTAPTQVNLRVQIAELSREVSRLIGINWESLFNAGSFTFGLATGRDFLPTGAAEVLRLNDANGAAGAILGGMSTSSASVTALIDLLERQGLLTVLAEPNLTALSGRPPASSPVVSSRSRSAKMTARSRSSSSNSVSVLPSRRPYSVKIGSASASDPKSVI